MRKGYCKVLLSVMLFVALLPAAYFKNIKSTDAIQLEKTNYQQTINVSGTVDTENKTEIKLSYPIIIDKCYINNNDYVNKGQLLFTLDIEKMKSYVKSNDLTQYFQTNNSFIKADIFDISKEIFATSSGTISELSAFSGDIVLSEEILCVINKDDSLILKITINQDDYQNINVGDTVTFSPTITPGKKYQATICDTPASIRKESSISGTKTVIDIFAVIDNPDDCLVSGLQFSGTVKKPHQETIYTLPYEFINQDEQGEYVNLYSDGHTSKIYIDTGIEIDDKVQIITKFNDNSIFLKDICKRKSLLNYVI